MTLSRLLGILSLISGLLMMLGTSLQMIKPTWAAYAIGIALAINAFTERVQGGKSKVEDADTMRFPKE